MMKNKIDWDDIKNKYVVERWSLRKIGSYYHITHNWIAKKLREVGVHIRNNSEQTCRGFIIKICPVCRKEFKVKLHMNRIKCCSISCGRKFIIKENGHWLKGKHFNQRENHPGWLGGKSFEKYGFGFNKRLKEKIRERDEFKCIECGYSQNQLGCKLDVHHLNYDKKDNRPENLISLCKSCHTQTNFKRKDWENYFNKKLSVSAWV